MTCTIWETGYQVYAMPYKMKKEYGQEPKHINQKYRDNWLVLTYSGALYRLQAGEWLEVEESFEDIVTLENKTKLEVLRKDLNRRIQETINRLKWQDEQLSSLRARVAR
jgi:hypothetical protein